MMDKILRLLFPPKCVLCKKLLERKEEYLCADCLVQAPVCPDQPRKKLPFLDSWTAVWYYEGEVRSSILRFKFRSAKHYAACYGTMLARALRQSHPEGFDILAWVPVSRLRKLRRGYDQVELLAEVVARELSMEPIPLLKKLRNNKAQSGITGYAHRKANVLGAYRLTEPELVKNKKILLLDDVITTGATIGECARVLLTAGCAEVHGGVVAVARHDDKQSR